MNGPKLLLVGLAAAALLSACDDDHAASAAAKKPVVQAPKPPAPPAPAAAPAPAYTYTYTPVGKRDPFRSPLEEIRPEVKPGGCHEPLCNWDLDQLTLVAVVTGDSNPIAMVEEPGGKGFIVRRNARMGKQGGKVTNILRDSITVTEYFTADGKVIANPRNMKLKEDNRGIPSMDLLTGKNVE